VDVLAGTLSLEEAMQRVLPLDHPLDPEPSGDAPVATAVQARAGALSLLAGGGPVPNPSAILAQPAMRDLLASMAADFDSVLIDAPSPLEVSDVMPLMTEVDGIVMVGRIAHTRETSARRLVQLVAQTASAPVLGVAANCVAAADMSRYGFSPPNAKAWPGRFRG
jgi:Mrp family chromosome partitioning ATPase